jgi:hypothetical protein
MSNDLNRSHRPAQTRFLPERPLGLPNRFLASIGAANRNRPPSARRGALASGNCGVRNCRVRALALMAASALPKGPNGESSAELLVHLRPVGQRLCRAVVESRRREQPPLGDLSRDRPRDPDHPGATHLLTNRRLADARDLAHLADADTQLMRQPQHLSDLTHRHSHSGHRLAPVVPDRGKQSPDSGVDGRAV